MTETDKTHTYIHTHARTHTKHEPLKRSFFFCYFHSEFWGKKDNWKSNKLNDHQHHHFHSSSMFAAQLQYEAWELCFHQNSLINCYAYFNLTVPPPKKDSLRSFSWYENCIIASNKPKSKAFYATNDFQQNKINWSSTICIGHNPVAEHVFELKYKYLCWQKKHVDLHLFLLKLSQMVNSFKPLQLGSSSNGK